MPVLRLATAEVGVDLVLRLAGQVLAGQETESAESLNVE